MISNPYYEKTPTSRRSVDLSNHLRHTWPVPVELPHDDAVTLAHLVAHECARSVGVRSLSIKGPVANTYGLRPPGSSADADIIVPFDAGPATAQALQNAGWAPREMSDVGRTAVEHSTSFTHQSWPCDIDLHIKWPGFTATPDQVFEALWERRTHLQLANLEVTIPDRPSSILIAVTHALRSPLQNARHSREFLYLKNTVIPELDAASRAELVELAVQLGAVDTARPLLEYLEVPLPAPVPRGISTELDAWRERVAARASETSKLLLALRKVPWARRPAFLARVIWPKEADHRMDHPETPPGTWAAVRGRLARIGRGIKALPGVIRGRRAARAGVTTNPFAADSSEDA